MLLLALYRIRSNDLGMGTSVMDYERRRTFSNTRDTPICK